MVLPFVVVQRLSDTTETPRDTASSRAARQFLYPHHTCDTPRSGSLLTQHVPETSQNIHIASAHTAPASRSCRQHSHCLLTHLWTHPFSTYIQRPYTLPTHSNWKQGERQKMSYKTQVINSKVTSASKLQATLLLEDDICNKNCLRM